MRALVTGSNGFVGRHMVSELRARGYQTAAIDLTPGWVEHSKTYRKIHDDANEYFRSSVRTRFDLVVHCAYHVGGRASIDGTNTNLLKNLQLDSSMFEWAVRTKQRRILYLSSSAIYPTFLQNPWFKSSTFGREYTPYRLQEDDCDPGEFDDPDADYGYAKLIGERLAQTARDNGVPVTVVRPFSGYAEDQSLDYPFPAIVSRVKAGDLTVWGPQGQSRDWIHISDVVSGALAVVESGTTEPVNLCTGVATTMGELAKKVESMLPGMHTNVSRSVTYDENKPTGVFYRVGDAHRMSQYYTPRVTLEEGIRRALSV